MGRRVRCWSLLFICFPCIKVLPHAVPRAGRGMVSGQCPDAREGSASLEASSELGFELFPWVVPELLLVQSNTRLLLKAQSLGSGTPGTGLSFPTQRISLLGGSLLEGAKRLSPKRCMSRPTLKPGCSESRIEEGSHSSIFSVLPVMQGDRGDNHPKSCSDHSSHHNIPFGSTNLRPQKVPFPFRLSGWSVPAAHGGMLAPAYPRRTGPFPLKVPCSAAKRLGFHPILNSP